MKRINLRLDSARFAEVEKKRTELGVRSVNEVFVRLWDAAGSRLQREGLGPPADRPAQPQK